MIEKKYKILLQELQQGFTQANIGFAKRYIEDLFVPNVKKGKKVLDIGCGEGPEEPKLLKEAGYNVTAISIQDWMKRENKNIKIMDMHDLKFQAETFDAIYSCMVFEHSYSPWLALIEAHTVLKPEGIMLLMLPAPGNYITVTHPTLLEEKRWRKIFQIIGFEVLNKDAFFNPSKKKHKVMYFVLKKIKPEHDKMINCLKEIRKKHA